SVHVPISELGARGVAILLDAITHKHEYARRRERVSTQLIIRPSTGASSAERPPPMRRARSAR
ncbi:MAG: hypothetical protein ABI556_10015, partial [Gemmatimonadales bacterium]